MTKSETSQARAQGRYRDRLRAEGLARFEVIGRSQDKPMIRALAKRLSETGTEAGCLRADVERLIGGDETTGRAIVNALRNSPLVGADISFERIRSSARKIEL